MNKLNLDDAFPLHINVLVINYEFNVVVSNICISMEINFCMDYIAIYICINTVRVSKVNLMNHFQDTEKCNLLLILGLLLPLGGLLYRVQVREAEAASILPARADLEV